jgi:membrane fusion protein (multidrug efflux system)
VVPNSSLLHDPVGDYVFVLSPDAEKKGFRAERRDVVVEKRQGGEVYLNEGLAAGETVAADGAFKLREGLLVFKAS